MPHHGPRSGRLVDVTVLLYSSGEQGSEAFLARQLQALDAQTVQPVSVVVHVDGSGAHDERSLARGLTLSTVRTALKMGRDFRLLLARQVETRWVLVLEEFALPGPEWIEYALSTLTAAEGGEPKPYGPAMIACGGRMLVDDRPEIGVWVGASAPRDRALHVDYGVGGWLFAATLATEAMRVPPMGGEDVVPNGCGITLAFAGARVGIDTAVMDYNSSRPNWGLSQPVARYDEHPMFIELYDAYRGMGWNPKFHGRGLASTAPGQLPGAEGGGAAEEAEPPPTSEFDLDAILVDYSRFAAASETERLAQADGAMQAVPAAAPVPVSSSAPAPQQRSLGRASKHQTSTVVGGPVRREAGRSNKPLGAGVYTNDTTQERRQGNLVVRRTVLPEGVHAAERSAPSQEVQTERTSPATTTVVPDGTAPAPLPSGPVVAGALPGSGGDESQESAPEA
jgi:hypothetical protein